MNREEFLSRYWRGEYMPNVGIYCPRESDATLKRGFLARWWGAAVLCIGGTSAAVGVFVIHPCPAHALAILAIWGMAFACIVRKVK